MAIPTKIMEKVNQIFLCFTILSMGVFIFPGSNRSRRILWLVTGSEKAGRLKQLRDADPSIPAGRVNQDRALVLADQAAAAELGTMV